MVKSFHLTILDFLQHLFPLLRRTWSHLVHCHQSDVALLSRPRPVLPSDQSATSSAVGESKCWLRIGVALSSGNLRLPKGTALLGPRPSIYVK